LADAARHILQLRLTFRAAHEAVTGLCETAEGPALAARVRAAPSEGEANAALEMLIARWFDLPKSCVALTVGQKSRIKTLTISGNSDALLARLEARLAEINPAQTGS
jgi:uncharacterized protein